MTLDQALFYFRCYADDLEEAAYSYGNTHALLYFRALMAKMVLREFDMYGKAEEWPPGHFQDFDNRQYDFHRTREKTLELLKGSKEFWRKESNQMVPNKKALHDRLHLLEESPLQKSNGDNIGVGRYRQDFDNMVSPEKEEEMRHHLFEI